MTGKVFHHDNIPTGEKLRNVIEQCKSDCCLAVHVSSQYCWIFWYVLCSSYKFPVLLQEFVADNLTLFLEHTKKTSTFARKLKLSLEMASGLKYLHS